MSDTQYTLLMIFLLLIVVLQCVLMFQVDNLETILHLIDVAC